MIELTEQQVQALNDPQPNPPQVVNPRTKETFVLLRAEEYRLLKQETYDDTPWTREELNAVAWDAGKRSGWDDMDEYDEIPEKS